MSLRACNCRAHRPPLEPNAAAATTADAARPASPQPPLPPHAAPTRALILQLSRFPQAHMHALQRPPADAASMELHSLHPHLATLMQLSASMRLAWSAPPAAAACAERAAEEDAERAGAVALRLLGLSTAELAASSHRADLLAAARSARARSSAAQVSPAADYPKMYGAGDVEHARMELATNHLPLMLRVDHRRRTMLLAEAAAASASEMAHCNQPVFLATQQPEGGEAGVPPFLPLPSPAPHSAAPLLRAADRGLYIQRIVRHVAARLALDAAADPSPRAAAAAASSPSPAAHILLLHIDAHSLLGAPRCGVDDAEHACAALTFADRLLAALMTQLSAPLSNDSSASAAASSAYPPPPPASAAASSVSAAAAASLPLFSPCSPTAPLQAAAQLFQSASLCSTLMWSCVVDDSEGQLDALPASVRASFDEPSSAAAAMRLSVLQSLRPTQSYRVQDGCIAAPSTRWFNCAAFIYHADSTRVSTAAELASATDAASSSAVSASASFVASCSSSPLLPTQGSVHITHFMRELLFKLGLGIKYGA